MIIIRTPYRISFFGGGTDYPHWYKKYKGKTISTSINKFSYIILSELKNFFKYKYRIRYYYREEAKNVDSIKHPTIRNLIKFKKLKQGISLYHYGDLPAKTGIGSSSSFTVGLSLGINHLQKKITSLKNIYTDAIFIEQKLNKEHVGSQDQIITTLGGFRVINYYKNKIIVKNLERYKKNIEIIEKSCLLFYSGSQRNSGNITKKNLLSINKKYKYYSMLYKIASKAEKLICSDKFTLRKFSSLLDESWKVKEKTSDIISNNKIKSLYAIAKKNGAMAGKLLGAGQSGFMLFIVKNEDRNRIKKALRDYVSIDIKFENEGTKIIYEKN